MSPEVTFLPPVLLYSTLASSPQCSDRWCTAASDHLHDIAVKISLLVPPIENLTDAVHRLEPPTTTQPSKQAVTSNSEARKLKASNFLKDYFAPLPQNFQSITHSVQHILPDSKNVEFRIEIQDVWNSFLLPITVKLFLLKLLVMCWYLGQIGICQLLKTRLKQTRYWIPASKSSKRRLNTRVRNPSSFFCILIYI